MPRDFLEVLQARKSIRSFSDAEVPDSLLEKLLAAATYAPTNCNQQLWNFVVVRDAATKERLITEAAGNTLFRRAPVVIAVTYDGWNYKEAIQGASLAVGHFLLAAEYYSVGALPMNSYGADSKIHKILGIPESETICCFIAVGFPDERAADAPPVPRKPVGDMLHRERWSGIEKPPFTYDPEDWTLSTLIYHQCHYSRKTSLGKEMDIMGQGERELIHRTLAPLHGPFLDLLSYDGAYVREFPPGKVTVVDLAPETSTYTRAAVALSLPPARQGDFVFQVYAPTGSLGEDSYRTATLLYKAERMSRTLRAELFAKTYAALQSHGTFVVIARKRNPFLSLFFLVVRILFGKDVRKTGIYNFFGPYAPVRVGKLRRELVAAGFANVTAHSFFAFPDFYEKLYEMFKQFIKSEGSSYLHREVKGDVVLTGITALLRFQGFRRVGLFGSVAVITCTK